MRKVAIVGGGQSGLQLALGLLQNQYEVTPDYSPWWFDPAEAGHMIKRMAVAAD